MSQSLIRASNDARTVYLIKSRNNFSGKTYPVEVAVAVAQYNDRTYLLLTSACWIPKINSCSSEQIEKKESTQYRRLKIEE